MNKVGLGIITCNREDFYRKCYDSIPHSKIDTLITVNDGKQYNEPPPTGTYLQHEQNKGVGISKNEALQYLLDQGCEHIFLIEDDILVKNDKVFDKYIETGKVTNLPHMMYGYHGPANKIDGKPTPRIVIDYGDGIELALNTHCVGAFCYYTRQVLQDVGLMDEAYKNAWEHVDHSYIIVKRGLIPAYWWWPDVANSCDYLEEQACSEELEHAAIRNRPDWGNNITTGMEHFYKKHGTQPGGPTGVPDTPQDDVIQRLKNIKRRT